MAKILLIGPAGSGKTHRLLDQFGKALSDAKDPFLADHFFVVPSAEHTERLVSLLIQRGLKGFFYKRVTTLSRLADDFFRVADIPVASSLTRTLIVRDLVRENDWDYFREVREQPGFIGLMAQFITGLKEACIPPGIFRRRMNALKGFEPAYGTKYEALADFYEQYENQLKARGLRDSQDALSIFRERKEKKRTKVDPGVRFGSLWIDGFFDFSNLQLEYLRELCAVTENITVTLTKEDGPSADEAFEPILRTREALEKLGFQVEPMKPKAYRTAKPSLLFLQKNLFSADPAKTVPDPGQDIVMMNAIGTEGEIEMIARQIHKLYASGDYRYSDFAVLFRQIRHYAPVIASVFARYGIPVEIHERERLKFSSWIAATVSLLSVFHGGWQREDLFAFLKSSHVRRFGKDIVRPHSLSKDLKVDGTCPGNLQKEEKRGQDKPNPLSKNSEVDWTSPGNLQKEEKRGQDKPNPLSKNSEVDWTSPGNLQKEEKRGQDKPNPLSKNSEVDWTSPGNLQKEEKRGQDKPNPLSKNSEVDWTSPGNLQKEEKRGQDKPNPLSKNSEVDWTSPGNLQKEEKRGQDKDDAWIETLEQRSFVRGVAEAREAWIAGWKKEEGEEEFDARKTETLKSLAELEDRFRAAKTAEEHIRLFKRAVYDTFGILEVSDRYTVFNRRDAACVKRFEALLEEIRSYFRKTSAEKVSFEAFADYFLGLVELDVYPLHERDKNRIQIYDVSLARQKEYKVVFVAGLLEKVFPMQVREDPLLSDWERKLMNGDMEHPLAECLPRQNIERFFFYLAVTRAKERLYLSCPHLDFEGKESLPSFYLEEVKDLFGERLKVIRQDLAHPFPKPCEAITLRELEASVVGALRNPGEPEPGWEEAKEELSGESQSRERLLSALRPVEAKISDTAISAGKHFEIKEASPTRLETYAKCPYRYFADKVLRLKDTGEDIGVMQKGNILHYVLQQYFDPQVHKDPGEALEKFIEREIEEGFKKYPMTWREPYAEALDRRELFEMLRDFLEFEIARLRNSSFQPFHVEYAFGDAGKNEASSLMIEGGERKLRLRGRVDRIHRDTAREYAVVMDYKRSAKFKAADLELGTALQLPLYLLAVQKKLGLKPLGAEIYSIRDHKRSGFYSEGAAKGFGKEFSPRSHLPDEVFQKVLERALVFARKFIGEITSASIPVRPRDCQSFCPYDTVCRIEKWRLPLIIEEIKSEMQADKLFLPFSVLTAPGDGE